jgi:y4mF family transcriptional regulator
MILRSAREIGDLIAAGRELVGWSQAELAENIGVSRQWVSHVERGRTTAEFHLVLKALQALGYSIAVHRQESSDLGAHGKALPISRPAGTKRTRLTSEGQDLSSLRPTTGEHRGE